MAEGEDIDLVEDIIITPFSRQTFQEKLDIVRRGRPTPTLQSLSQAGKGFVRHFQSSNYERYQWLTGSEKHCKLYCWECLLFASDRFGVWSHTGFANLSCLTKAATRHQSTAGHLQAMVLLKTFGDTRVDLQLNEQARRATGAAQWKGIVLFPCNSLNKNVNFKVTQRLVILRFCLNV